MSLLGILSSLLGTRVSLLFAQFMFQCFRSSWEGVSSVQERTEQVVRVKLTMYYSSRQTFLSVYTQSCVQSDPKVIKHKKGTV
jgi:hypothetical protein